MIRPRWDLDVFAFSLLLLKGKSADFCGRDVNEQNVKPS